MLPFAVISCRILQEEKVGILAGEESQLDVILVLQVPRTKEGVKGFDVAIASFNGHVRVVEEEHVLEGLVLANPKGLGPLTDPHDGLLVESVEVPESTPKEDVASFFLHLDEGVLAERLVIVWDFDAIEVKEIGCVVSKIMHSSRKRKRKRAHSLLHWPIGSGAAATVAVPRWSP